MSIEAQVETKADNLQYQEGLEKITRLSMAEDVESVSKLLGLNTKDVQLALDCVGNGQRKGNINLDGSTIKLTHFSHMVRVAYMVMYFFPEDSEGKRLALLHDTKEEALPNKQSLYLQSDLSREIELLTEQEPTENEIAFFKSTIPSNLDPVYFAKYKKYISLLHQNWSKIRGLEICDRLDGSSSFTYLLDKKYAHRLPEKSLETFARIWATISVEKNEITEQIKNNCRIWFHKLGIKETDVEKISLLFL